MQCQPQLLEIVLALYPSSGFASLLDSREQQRHQNRNNGNNDQQFNQGKPSSATLHLGNPTQKKPKFTLKPDSRATSLRLRLSLNSILGEWEVDFKSELAEISRLRIRELFVAGQSLLPPTQGRVESGFCSGPSRFLSWPVVASTDAGSDGERFWLGAVSFS